VATTSPSDRPPLALVRTPAPPDDGPRIDAAEADRLYGEAMAIARRAGRLAAVLEQVAARVAPLGWHESAAACRRAEAGLRTTAQAIPEAPPGRAEAKPRRVIAIGQLSVDCARRLAFWGGAPVLLTRLEFDLLVALAERAGEVVPKADLLRSVWGYAGRVTRTRTVDSHASRLRRSLCRAGADPGTIANVWGVGYRLCVAEPGDAA
jgi:DNA-binding response OmpR family regulator